MKSKASLGNLCGHREGGEEKKGEKGRRGGRVQSTGGKSISNVTRIYKGREMAPTSVLLCLVIALPPLPPFALVGQLINTKSEEVVSSTCFTKEGFFGGGGRDDLLHQVCVSYMILIRGTAPVKLSKG